MHISKYTTAVLALALSLLLIGTQSTAYAETAGQRAQDSYAPPVVRAIEGGIIMPEDPYLEIPAGAEKLMVTPSGLTVEGTLRELEKQTAELAASITNKQVSGADLYALARKLETAYVQAGFVLVRINLPPQTVQNGMPLKLLVINGHIDAIDTSALPDKVRQHVDSLLAPLIDKRGLKQRELERRLLLAGDMPGITLKSTLQRGHDFSTTTLVVSGRYESVNGFIYADNSLSDEMGDYMVSLGIDVNNLLQQGEVMYLRLSGYPGFTDNHIFSSDPRNRQVVAGMTVPLSNNGWWLNLEAVDSRTESDNGLPYTLPDHYKRLNTQLGYHWLRGRAANLSSTASYVIVSEKQTLDFSGSKSDFSEDQLRILRLSQNGDIQSLWGGKLSGNVTLSFGLNSLGARQATTALPMSRDGAESNFQKLNASINYSKAIASNRLQLSLASQMQTSFGDPLPGSEQMSITNQNWLSAYDSGSIQADKGISLRAELGYPLATTLFKESAQLSNVIVPYTFAAGGVATLENPTSVEERVTRAHSLGAGVRFGLSKQDSPYSTTLALEYAHGNATAMESESRFNLNLMTRF